MTTDLDFLLPSKRRHWSLRRISSALALWIGLTLLATMVVHLLIVFALPSIGRGVLIEDIIPANDATPRLYTGQGGEARPEFSFADNRTDSVYCSFDLRDGAVRVTGSLDVPFWSMSVHTLSGLVVGSVNHNAATGGGLELLVMRPALARDLAEAGAQLPQEALVVEMDGPLGVVRISGLATYTALRPALRDALSEVECSLATFTFADPNQDAEENGQNGRPRAPSGPPEVPQPVARPDGLSPGAQDE